MLRRFCLLILFSLAIPLAFCYDGSGTYTIYDNGTVNRELIFHGWYNVGLNTNAVLPTESEDDAAKRYLEFKPEDGGKNASGGWRMEGQYNTGNLHAATLNFKWYATATGTYKIRLTCHQDEDCSFEVTENDLNAWHEVSWSLPEKYPITAQSWNENRVGGAGYVFSVVVENSAGGSIFFDDVKYTNVDEGWTPPVVERDLPENVPTPIHERDKVKSFFSSYGDNVNFNFADWAGTKHENIKIADQDVIHLMYYTYQGFDAFDIDISEYDYMHVDYYTYNGVKFGITPISLDPTKENVYTFNDIKTEQWNSLDAPISHFSEAGVDLTHIKQIKIDGGNYDEGYVTNIYFWKSDGSGSGGEEPEQPEEPVESATFNGFYKGTDVVSDQSTFPFELDYSITYNPDRTLTFTGNLVWGENGSSTDLANDYNLEFPNGNIRYNKGLNESVTTNEKFNQGDVVNMQYWIARAYGRLEVNIEYVVGSINEPEAPSVKLIAEAKEITNNSAKIHYTVTIPEGWNDENVTVKYKEESSETEFTAENGVIVLLELTPSTPYTYVLTATANNGSEVLESEPVRVSFKTLRDNAEPVYYYEIVNGYLENAYLEGEDPHTDRRNLPSSFSTEVIYNPDNSLTINFEEFTIGNVVGWTPQININGEWSSEEPEFLVKTGDGTYTYHTGKVFDEGDNVIIYFYNAYNGGVSRIDLQPIKVGETTNSQEHYGNPAEIIITSPSDVVEGGITVPIDVYMKDEFGNFLFKPKPEIRFVKGDDIAALDDTKTHLTMNGRGQAILEASYGELEPVQLTFTCNNFVDVNLVNLAHKVREQVKISASNTIDGNYETDEARATYLQQAIDGSPDSEVVFLCNDGRQEHWLQIDLGANYKIERVTLVWEGASAKEYTVTLEDGPPTAHLDAESDDTNDEIHTYATYTNASQTVTDGLGGAGLTVTKHLYYDIVGAQYVTLKTSTAYVPAWNIKLKEIGVYGKDVTTGVSGVTVEDEDMPVEYYNLQGMRVDNPSAGLYIRKQGNISTKVLIRK